MAASQKILLGLIVLVLLAFPTLRYFGWPAVVGYIVGLVATTASLLYLFCSPLVGGSQDVGGLRARDGRSYWKPVMVERG